jgi:hypothetical protein
MTTLADKLSISKDVLLSEVNDEAVLFNQSTGKYFTLDEIGTQIYKFTLRYGWLAQVHQAMLAEYNVDPKQLEQDLLTLTDQLIANGLLKLDVS